MLYDARMAGRSRRVVIAVAAAAAGAEAGAPVEMRARLAMPKDRTGAAPPVLCSMRVAAVRVGT